MGHPHWGFVQSHLKKVLHAKKKNRDFDINPSVGVCVRNIYVTVTHGCGVELEKQVWWGF